MQATGLTPGVAFGDAQVFSQGPVPFAGQVQLHLVPPELQQPARQTSTKFARSAMKTLTCSRMAGYFLYRLFATEYEYGGIG